MAKDDYFVVIYYILNYLYECLKRGISPDENILYLKYYPNDINDSYLEYIYTNLLNDGYIDDVDIVNIPRLGTKERTKYLKNLKNIKITPMGIEYLQENSLMKKAYNIVKDFKPW